MIAANGSVRPHWQPFIDSLMRFDPAEMRRRWDLGQRLLRDNGVTYNVYGDPAGLDRPWQLDPLPVILSREEWDTITQGVIQRAGLLETILDDLYGPRSLVARGLVPSALLHANPDFLRPCHGWIPAGGKRLHTYAADLARGHDGRWRVVGDRTENPSGAGYALENRAIVSRVLPELHRSHQVERLGPYFDALYRSLPSLSPRHTDDPRIVLLTPGPYNSTYFEHAFLARQLGVTLVQGEDLTVRDNHVYLKALTGLQRVDVILRRTGGSWCDPLELRGDSTLGVAGLLQSARVGNVAVANAIGTGLLDGASLMGFMPALSQTLLGQPLILGSVPTWWCGEPDACRHVIDNLERLIVRPAFVARDKSLVGAGLTAPEAARLKAAITSRPWDWVAQEIGGTSTVPVWTGGFLESQHCVIRVFATNTDKGWQVLPGGLARLSAERDLMTTRLQTGGGGSKDVWISSTGPRDGTAAGGRVRAPEVRLTRDNRDLPSRVADNMFWLGRYLERCESTTRLLRATLSHMEEALAQDDAKQARETLVMMGLLGLHLPTNSLRTAAETLPGVLLGYHLDGAKPGLANAVDRMIRVVTNLRDRLSADTWRAVQRLREEVGALGHESLDEDVIGRLNSVLMVIQAINGLAMENMTRGPQWLFLDAGRRLERAIAMVDTLSGALTDAESEDAVPLELLLELWDSVMTYRSRYLASPRLAGVLDLLLCDESNPRSLAFQVVTMAAHTDRLAAIGDDTGFYTPAQKLMTILLGTVRTTDVAVLSRFERDAGYHDAERLLDFLRSRLWELSEQVTRTYFTHAQWRLPVTRLEVLP
ncbi:MAG: circularly permuted type 2 ATP-grasp protein [Alphaproteobacteria bacterium]|nr:circularly permuted type 2 ATP-grasp protein [Alphaproteobacteria bacterium]